MSRRRHPHSKPARDDVDTALAALPADALREVVREMLLELDGKAHARVINGLIQRAARSGSGWAPGAVDDEQVAEVLAFTKAAERVGRADPSVIDEYLRRGSAAFLRKNYAAARQILGALLRPIGDGEIDLGQDEMAEEMLGADTGQCAAQYVVSAYMLSPPADRAAAVRTAIAEVQELGHFWEPIRELERVAVEPLPGLKDFLSEWRALIVQKPASGRRSDWDTEEDRWLREVVQRLEGSEGLAKVARTTKRADDLRAWCTSLVDARDWPAALPAFEEAAGIVVDTDHARAELLDGAALAAQRLGHKDLSAWLERAWRAGPSMLRLRRWLGSADSKASLLKRASEALLACPTQAARERAFLHMLMGEFEMAAKLLAVAPGLGWSNGEHPGHLLFPLFTRLLGGKKKTTAPRTALRQHMDLDELDELDDLDDLDDLDALDDGPHLAAPEVDALLELAGIATIQNPQARNAVMAAMRKAAENRLAGVTEEKRRRHYGEAAVLVGACVSSDASQDTARWAASLRTEYKRFPALRAELDRVLGVS